MDKVLDLLLDNLWRTLCIALAITCAAYAVQNHVLHADLRVANATAKELAESHEAAALSATSWEQIARDCEAGRKADNAAAEARAKRDAEAVARVEAYNRDADATLRAWMDRYAQMLRNPDCAAIEAIMVCEVAP